MNRLEEPIGLLMKTGSIRYPFSDLQINILNSNASKALNYLLFKNISC
jgi:hypothetical protein